MKIPLGKLRRKELLWLSTHKCKHSMDYISHQNCYFEEILKDKKVNFGKDPIPTFEKVGFLDIESTSLNSNFGFVLCYCILEGDTDTIHEYCISKKEINKCLDRKVIESVIKDLKKFDRIYTFYGSRFDIKMLRARALYHNLDFPVYGEILHTDIYFMVRNRFKLSRNSLDSAHNFLVGDTGTEKTRWGRDLWVKGGIGDPKALEYILQHCRNDVILTRQLFEKIDKYSQTTNRSI